MRANRWLGVLIGFLILVAGLIFLVVSMNNQADKISLLENKASQADNQPKHVDESKEADGKKYQSVFLSDGNVYFGKIDKSNSDYVTLTSIYYLKNNKNPQAASANPEDVSLVKLGCELHGPTDKMNIRKDKIIFWEDLKDDSQVSKAIREYTSSNSMGQRCTTT